MITCSNDSKREALCSGAIYETVALIQSVKLSTLRQYMRQRVNEDHCSRQWRSYRGATGAVAPGRHGLDGQRGAERTGKLWFNWRPPLTENGALTVLIKKFSCAEIISRFRKCTLNTSSNKDRGFSRDYPTNQSSVTYLRSVRTSRNADQGTCLDLSDFADVGEASVLDSGHILYHTDIPKPPDAASHGRHWQQRLSFRSKMSNTRTSMNGMRQLPTSTGYYRGLTQQDSEDVLSPGQYTVTKVLTEQPLYAEEDNANISG
uniref:Uncharacterized protein n=1 Tax=Timema cristinae TaxID=61476 RepID=A0A7R9GQ77_TIMCR|nr:unnamed protein product [Timema cristinae]